MTLLSLEHKLCRSCFSVRVCRPAWVTHPISFQGQNLRFASSSSGSKAASEARPDIDDNGDRPKSSKIRTQGRKADAGSTKTTKASPKPKERSERNERKKTRAPNGPAPPSTSTSADTICSIQAGLPTAAQISRGQGPLRSAAAKSKASSTAKLDPSALPRMIGPRVSPTS
jgi:hypothetical protein